MLANIGENAGFSVIALHHWNTAALALNSFETGISRNRMVPLWRHVPYVRSGKVYFVIN
jgi:hypothetical protein